MRAPDPGISAGYSIDRPSSDARPARTGERRAWFPDSDAWVSAAVYDRNALPTGCVVEGPAFVEERESTVVIGPGDRAEVDAIRKWQASAGKPATGYLDMEGAQALVEKGMETPPPGEHRERLTQAVRDTLAKALRAVGEIENPDDRAHALVGIGAIFSEAGDAQKATRTFDMAEAAAETIQDEINRDFAFSAIAAAQTEAGDLQAALVSSERMADPVRAGETLIGIANSQAVSGDVDGGERSINRAVARIEGVSDFGDRARLFSWMASKLTELGHAEWAAQSIQQGRETAERIAEEHERNVALTHIVSAEAAAEVTPTAVLPQVYAITDLERRSDAIYEIVKVAAEAGDIQQALDTLKFIEDGVYQLDWALLSIVRAQVEVGDIRSALLTADRIASEANRSQALADIARAQMKAGHVRASLATADRIGDYSERSELLAEVAQVQVESGDTGGAAQSIKNALEFVQGIEEDYLRDFPLIEIAKAQAKAGDLKGALVTVGRISSEFYLSFSIPDIFQMGVEVGEAQDSQHIADQLGDELLRSHALSGIVRAQLSVGDLPAALATADGIQDAQVRASTLASIAEAQLKGGSR